MCVLSFLSFWILLLHIVAIHTVAEECKVRKSVDIGFMLDESGSVKSKDWKNIGKFTKIIAEAASMNRDVERASVVTFDDSSRLQIRFDTYHNHDAFARAVDNLDLKKVGGGTNIIDALNRGLNEMFMTSNGMRETSEKIAVLITDGKDKRESINSTSMYKEIGRKYKERNIKLLIIGVGDVDRHLLKKLVKEENDFFVAENFDELLGSVVTRIAENVQGVCEAINCQWSNWILGECSNTCGNGFRTDTRTKLVEEENGGACIGQSTKIESCNIQTCPVNCTWESWKPWSDCTESCGAGTRTKSRTKLVIEAYGGTCSGNLTITQPCKMKECPAKVHCEWSEWKIGKCDKSCGGGHRTNTRSLKMDAKNGGKRCSGSSVITEKCNLHKCADFQLEKGPIININDISIGV